MLAISLKSIEIPISIRHTISISEQYTVMFNLDGMYETVQKNGNVEHMCGNVGESRIPSRHVTRRSCDVHSLRCV